MLHIPSIVFDVSYIHQHAHKIRCNYRVSIIYILSCAFVGEYN